MSLSHASDWPVSLALRGKDKHTLRLLRARLEQFEDFRGHGHFAPRCFRLPKGIEDCPLAKVHVFDPDSEDLLGPQASIKNDLRDILC